MESSIDKVEWRLLHRKHGPVTMLSSNANEQDMADIEFHFHCVWLYQLLFHSIKQFESNQRSLFLTTNGYKPVYHCRIHCILTVVVSAVSIDIDLIKLGLINSVKVQYTYANKAL